MQSTGLVRPNSLARQLSEIIKELDAGYNPSRELINQQIKALPGQEAAQVSGLQATQAQSFDNILAGARDRGMGFSGIPLQEQAKYTASEFLPAVARVKQSLNDSKTSLLGALNSTNNEQRLKAQDIWQTELNRDESARQFNEQQAAARRAASASSGGFSLGNAYSAASKAAGAQVPAVKIPAGMQTLFNQVFIKPEGGEWDDKSLVSDYNATLKSARYGNARDKQKLELYHAARPDLFGSSIPAAVLGNGGKMSY